MTLRVCRARVINALTPLLINLTLTVVLGIGDKVNKVEWAKTLGQPVITHLQNPPLLSRVLPVLPALTRIPVKPGPGLTDESVRQQCIGEFFSANEQDPTPLPPPRHLLTPTIPSLILLTLHFLGKTRLVWKQGPPTTGKKSRGTTSTTNKDKNKAVIIEASARQWCPTRCFSIPLNPRHSPALQGLPDLFGPVLPKTKPLKAAARAKVNT